MPRVTTLDPIRRRLNRTLDFVRGQMKRQGITQGTLAREMGISQQSVSNKFRSGNFTAKELLFMLDYLRATKEEIGELIGG